MQHLPGLDSEFIRILPNTPSKITKNVVQIKLFTLKHKNLNSNLRLSLNIHGSLCDHIEKEML